MVVPTPVNASNMVFKVPGLGIARGVERHREGGFEEQVERTTRTLHGFSHERVDEYAEMYLPRGCRQKSLLQIITARSWQMAKYDAVLLA